MIVGLSGYGLVGKDEVGRILTEKHGFTRFAKGDLIKDAALAINPLIEVFPVVSLRLSVLVGDSGWDGVKKLDDGRRFLQNLADEMVEVCGRDVWNDALYVEVDRHFKKAAEKPVVLTRLSLPIECAPIKERGGQVWRVERPGYGPANSHPNEIALDSYPFDRIITNDGSLADLEVKVAEALA